ncbi:Annexin A10, partial [Lamprotornis superbus]
GFILENGFHDGFFDKHLLKATEIPVRTEARLTCCGEASCAEVDPREEADPGGKAEPAQHCQGPLHSRAVIVPRFSTALLSTCIFTKALTIPTVCCPRPKDNGGPKEDLLLLLASFDRNLTAKRPWSHSSSHISGLLFLGCDPLWARGHSGKHQLVTVSLTVASGSIPYKKIVCGKAELLAEVQWNHKGLKMSKFYFCSKRVNISACACGWLCDFRRPLGPGLARQIRSYHSEFGSSRDPDDNYIISKNDSPSDLLSLEENVKVRLTLVHKQWIHFAEHYVDKYIIHFLVVELYSPATLKEHLRYRDKSRKATIPSQHNLKTHIKMYCGDYTQGTILPAPNFNPIMDAQLLGGALQGISCEKDVLIEILTQRCNSQRLMIAEAYRDMYGRDLITDLKENLSHHFKEVMVGLMYPPASYDAHELWHALKGVDTEEKCLIDILSSRSNMEIFQIKEAYLMQYNTDLQQDIDSETSGHFRDTLMNLAQGTRMEGYADPSTAAQDAMILWEACQQKIFFKKNMLQMILCNRSHQQLWMGNPAVQLFEYRVERKNEFQNISGQDIVDAINECYDGYFQELLVAIGNSKDKNISTNKTVLCIRDKPSYFAYRLYNAIHDFGFHNKTVIRILIARSEIDLVNIRQRYKERYGKSLFHDIKHFASGHYESALLAICAAHILNGLSPILLETKVKLRIKYSIHSSAMRWENWKTKTKHYLALSRKVPED